MNAKAELCFRAAHAVTISLTTISLALLVLYKPILALSGGVDFVINNLHLFLLFIAGCAIELEICLVLVWYFLKPKKTINREKGGKK